MALADFAVMMNTITAIYDIPPERPFPSSIDAGQHVVAVCESGAGDEQKETKVIPCDRIRFWESQTPPSRFFCYK